MKNETKLTDDDIAGMRLESKRRRRRLSSKTNLCSDCGQPTENEGYCNSCELRHIQFRGDLGSGIGEDALFELTRNYGNIF